MRRAVRELREWRRNLRAWLTQEGAEEEAWRVASSEAATQTISALPLARLAGLEARYEMLLRLGAIDREPLQRRTAADVRHSVVSHVLKLASIADARHDEALLRVACDFASTRTGRELDLEEAGIYRLSISALQHRAWLRRVDA
jgi:hypothetical protein